MRDRSRIAIEIIRRGAAIACVALGLWMFFGVVKNLIVNLPGTTAGGIALALAFVLFLWLPLNAFLVWLGWRLWARWNPMTVRWGIGTVLAILIAWVDNKLSRHFILLGGVDPGPFSPAIVPLLIIGGLLFRTVTHQLIRKIGMEEPVEWPGQAPGHQTRVRFFAGLLGFAVWLSGMGIARRVGNNSAPDIDRKGAIMLASIVLGYAANRLVRWLMRPPIRRPAESGPAFEVVQ